MNLPQLFQNKTMMCTCCLSYSDSDKCTTLKCGHSYIKRCLMNSKKNRCVVCNYRFDPYEYCFTDQEKCSLIINNVIRRKVSLGIYYQLYMIDINRHYILYIKDPSPVTIRFSNKDKFSNLKQC